MLKKIKGSYLLLKKPPYKAVFHLHRTKANGTDTQFGGQLQPYQMEPHNQWDSI
jgi:hypothetical protein